MIEIKHIQTIRKEVEGKRYIRDEYDIGYYKVDDDTTIYPDGSIYRRIQVYAQRSIHKNSSLYYLPDIYCRYDWKTDELVGFEVQTTSYGSLDMEHFAKFLSMQQYAIEVVGALTDKYIAK